MSDQKDDQQKTQQQPATEDKLRLKPCCACPETKQVRDEWSVAESWIRFQLINLFYPVLTVYTHSIIENGEENCQQLIEAHKKCMRDLGFRIWASESFAQLSLVRKS